MGFFEKAINKASDTLFNENEFNKGAIELVRFNSTYDRVFAIHDKENSELRFFKELNLKRNDKLIDKHDNVYFVEEVIIDQPYILNLNNLIVKEKTKTVKTLVVKYSKKQIEIPEIIKQSVKNGELNYDDGHFAMEKFRK